jgi:3-phosphoshikimate 1-carboxyvinyltransferase
MPESLSITPISHPVRASIRPPGSKSLTNRALVCSVLAAGTSTLRGALKSEDTEVMIASLKALGIKIEVRNDGETLIVEGCAGKLPTSQANLYVANSGTTMRFLTALVTLGNGEYHLDGIPRMRARPIGDLVASLESLGANIHCIDGCPPVVVHAAGLAGGSTTIHGNVSSQFLSGLLMTAPYALNGVTIQVEGPLVSVPYVRMTQQVMKAFGVTVSAAEDYCRIVIPGGSRYQSIDYSIEPDASAASYFFAVAAITGGTVTVEGLGPESLQGDVDFCECLRQMGCQVHYGDHEITVVGQPLRAIDVDMNAISDTVQTLAIVALFAEGTTRIRQVEHIRYKETDRIGDLATELRKLGAKVVEHEDGLEIIPMRQQPVHRGNMSDGSNTGASISSHEIKPSHEIKSSHEINIDTYNDHRMAMSFALAGLKIPGVKINNPGCTEKTYPNFFSDLAHVIGAI